MSIGETSDRLSSHISPLLERGQALMRARDWAHALEAFDRAASADQHAIAAWDGVAGASMFLDDFDRARSAMERVFAEAQRAGDWRTAARAAMRIAMFHEGFRRERAIANGWFERARTLIAGRTPGAEHAWLAMWEAHVAIHLYGEIAEGQQRLADALRLRDAAEPSVEFDLLARGLAGLIAISEGAIEDGLRQLDEAATVTIAELPSPHIVGWVCCYVLDACERVRDFTRAQQWIERGALAGRQMAVPHFISFCRSHYLGVLIGRGEYDAAEDTIDSVRAAVGSIAPTFASQCDIRLAEVRRRQGRLDAADELLDRHRAQPQAMLALAGIALDRGQAQHALDLGERYLRRVSSRDRVRRVHGLEPVARALVRLGQDRAARTAIEEIRRLAMETGVPYLAALVNDLDGLAAHSRGDVDEARRRLEDAADGYDLNCAPYEAAAARIALGVALRTLGHAESANAALSAAQRGATRIGAKLLAASAERELGGPSSVATALSSREREVLALVAEGINNQEIGERLCISAFTVKRHIANILTKLQQPSRAAAAAYAIRERLL